MKDKEKALLSEQQADYKAMQSRQAYQLSEASTIQYQILPPYPGTIVVPPHIPNPTSTPTNNSVSQVSQITQYVYPHKGTMGVHNEQANQCRRT